MKRSFVIFFSMVLTLLFFGCDSQSTITSTTTTTNQATLITSEEAPTTLITTEELTSNGGSTTILTTDTTPPVTTATTAQPTTTQATTTTTQSTTTIITTQGTTTTVITTESITSTTIPTTIATTMAPQEYTIVFVENGGSEITDIAALEGSNVTEPNDPTKEGHTFAGWFSDDELTSEYVFSIMPSENLSLYAKWTPNTYLLEYLIVDENPKAYISLALGETIIELSLGSAHSVALTSLGRVFTWGENISGELGNGTTGDEFPNPIDITTNFTLDDNEKIIDIDMGSCFSAALTSLGRLFMWGSNGQGVLGNGTTNRATVPINITANFNLAADEKIIGISMGYAHSAAITSDGRVFTWGSNGFGQLGNGNTTTQYLPTDITSQFSFEAGENVIKIELGSYHTALLTSMGNVFAWGRNNYGQLGIGDDTITTRTTPVNMTLEFSLPENESITDISLHENVSGAISSLNRVFTWGENSFGGLGTGGSGGEAHKESPYDITDNFPMDPLDKITSISVGKWHMGAVSDFGRIFTWGYNDSGQLGNNTIIGQLTPAGITPRFELEENEKIIQVAASNSHTAALTSQGRAFLWGSNYHGKIGSGEEGASPQLTPYELEVEKVNKLQESLVFFDEPITILQPTREGHTFSGWYLDKDFQEAFSLGAMPANDLVLYGYFWIPTE
ncbi:MAG: InlB B-repeat-containing protein [Candidatus Izemoplasmatales bacterium]|nr:InlB B-repeat-containing protein [Candidatus Izemoplasmatales bacterium]MDD4354709.1 InlB B-repeat-containing protein [Candidatus Izemoplasmatales bacterium]MDY0373124.1 InlB B-repeat-containing protein [Candidatus Izemoplasmatales bacterium]